MTGTDPRGRGRGTKRGRHLRVAASAGPAPADPVLLTALGHLHGDDSRVVELRLGLNGGPALSPTQTAQALGVSTQRAEEREVHALAKLRHPSTPGDLTYLQRL